MTLYLLTPKAKLDTFEIWSWIARDSYDSADAVEAAIYVNCELVGAQPGVGHRRVDLTSRRLLAWPAIPYEMYLIFYDPETRPVQIQRVLHAYRRRPWKRSLH